MEWIGEREYTTKGLGGPPATMPDGYLGRMENKGKIRLTKNCHRRAEGKSKGVN